MSEAARSLRKLDTPERPRRSPEGHPPARSPTSPARISWGEFLADFDWRQGDHLTAVAPTKWGKTTLIQELLRDQSRPAPWIAVLSTKKRDPTIDLFARQGFDVRRRWDIPDPDLCPRVVIAPKIGGFESIDRQREIFLDALDAIYRQGGWTVVLDELRIISDQLNLRREVETLVSQGRSHGITVVGGTQRPRHVPLLVYDQARHLFFGRDNDRNNAKRFAEISGGPDPRELEAVIRDLDMHEWLYVDTEPPGKMVRVLPEL